MDILLSAGSSESFSHIPTVKYKDLISLAFVYQVTLYLTDIIFKEMSVRPLKI